MEGNIDQGQTILLSTHITSDIERVCSHVAILHNGCILCHASLDEIKERVRAVTVTAPPYPSKQHVLGRTRELLLDLGPPKSTNCIRPVVLKRQALRICLLA